jgi:hypothetical protein
MITAMQARALSESNAKVQAFLDNVEKQIKDAASSGKRTVTIHQGEVEVIRMGYRFYPEDSTQLYAYAYVCNKLVAKGYTAEIKMYGDSYVPRGLKDSNGNGPIFRNYGIVIGW